MNKESDNYFPRVYIDRMSTPEAATWNMMGNYQLLSKSNYVLNLVIPLHVPVHLN